MKIMIKVLVLVLILAVVSWLGYGFFVPTQEISYITEPVRRGKVMQTVSATGELSSSHLVDVGVQVSGQIKKMYVKVGDVVKKGDMIAQIDSVAQTNTLNTRKAQLDSMRAQLSSAQVSLKTIERKFARYRILAQEGAVSALEMEELGDALAAARAKVKQLQASMRETQVAINTAQSDIGYTRITAPIDGTVVSLVVEEGQTINSSQTSPTVVQIADLSEMTNKMQIAEGDVTKIQAGQKVLFTILSEPDTPIETRLDSIDPALTTMSKGAYNRTTDNSNNAVYYYARTIVPNPDGKLAIGMTTQNTIEIASTDNVLMVPVMALKNRDGKKFVRVLDEYQQPQEKEVQIGLRDSMNVEIKAGLNEGEQVIMSEISQKDKDKQKW